MDKFIDFLTTSDKFITIPLLLSLFSVLFILGNFFVLYNYLPPKVPLFYSLPWGQDELVNKQQFLLLPAILAGLTFINTLITSQIHPIQTVLKRLLMLSLLLINSVILITALRILFIFV